MFKKEGRRLKKIKLLIYNSEKKNFKILFSIKEKKIANIFILNSVLIIKLFTFKM